MKKTIAVFSTVLALILALLLPLAAGAQSAVFDVDENGVVDISDVTVVLNCLAGTTETEELPDLNGDGIVDISDVTLFLNVLSSSCEHEPVIEPATEPTCTEPGYTATVYCPECGIVFQEKSVNADPLGHDFADVGGDPVCSRCGECRTEDGQIYLLSDDGSFYTFAGYVDGAVPETVVIAGSKGGLPVKAIAAEALFDSGVRSLSLPASITFIGDDAFYGCKALETVDLADLAAWCSVEIEGTYSLPFKAQTVLTVGGEKVDTLVIPEGVTEIAPYAFNRCNSFTDVVFPDSLEKIGKAAFANCGGLTSVAVPAGVAVGDLAFSACENLTEVLLNPLAPVDGEDVFGNGIFSHCTALDTVIVSDGVTVIPASTFLDCSSLRAILIPASVAKIGDYAFMGCDSLVGAFISDLSAWCVIDFESESANPLSGGAALVLDNYAIVDLVVPDDVDHISAYAFCGSSIQAALIPGSVRSIGDYAFCGSALVDVVMEPGVESIGAYAFAELGLLIVQIPEGVTSLGDYAFFEDDTMFSVSLPSTLTEIPDHAFQYCYRLAEVVNSSPIELTVGAIDNGFVAAYAVIAHSLGRSYIVQSNGYLFLPTSPYYMMIGYIGNSVDLNLPNIGTYYAINSFAFFGNTDIRSVVMPINVLMVGPYAFYGCESLRTVTIGANVQAIYTAAFYDCMMLVEVVNNSNYLPIIAGSAGNGYVGYYAIEVHSGESKMSYVNDTYQFYTRTVNVGGEPVSVNYLVGYVGFDSDLVLPESYYGQPYSIYDYAFLFRDDITSVVIPDGVEAIGTGAFYGCSNLESVVIGDGITDISNGAFYQCSSLADLTLGANVRTIGNYAFYQCESLKDFAFPANLQIIGGKAFEDCKNLTVLEFPDSLMSIGVYAFSGCEKLRKVVVGSESSMLIAIGDEAFVSCFDLAVVENYSSLPFEAGSTNFGWIACYATEVHNYLIDA